MTANGLDGRPDPEPGSASDESPDVSPPAPSPAPPQPYAFPQPPVRPEPYAPTEPAAGLTAPWTAAGTNEETDARGVRPPSPGLDPGSLPPGPSSHYLEVAVHVATYLGAAGLGGIIGNRADSALVRAATGLFGAVRDRWEHRHPEPRTGLFRSLLRRRERRTPGPELLEEEAVDAAIAAALTQGYTLANMTVRAAELRADGRWAIDLGTGLETIHVTVPPGDPARATILLLAEHHGPR